MFNFEGNNIFIDVVGIYDDHNHDDRYYTEAESTQRSPRSNRRTRLRSQPVHLSSTTTPERSSPGRTSSRWRSQCRTATPRNSAPISGRSRRATARRCSVRIQANAIDLAPAEGTNNAFDPTEVGTAVEKFWEEASIVRSALVPAGTYTVQASAFVPLANMEFRLDDLMLFAEAHLIPA